MSSGVYALLDCNNTVRYVGQSSNIEKRFKWHRSQRKWPVKWLLLQLALDRDERLTQEREWVRVFGGHLEGHFLENKTLGGDPGADSLTMKTRSVISEKSLSMWADPAWKARQCKLIKEGINKNTKEYRSAVAVKRRKNPKTVASIKAAEGYTNEKIGKRLYISLSTVKGHISNISGKLLARNRTEAVARARQLGILQ